MKQNKQKGFTLIEMLVVIVIIAILASILLVALGSIRSRGRDTRRIADLRQSQNALELYYTKFNRYPAGGGVNSWQTMSTAITSGGIGINAIANDPLSPAQTYEYGVSADGQSYALRAVLEDIDNPVFKDDADGTQYGVNCDDAPTGNYCVLF